MSTARPTDDVVSDCPLAAHTAGPSLAGGATLKRSAGWVPQISAPPPDGDLPRRHAASRLPNLATVAGFRCTTRYPGNAALSTHTREAVNDTLG